MSITAEGIVQRPKELFDVKNKIVIVTGGLGQLGRQFSLSLADRGARVAIFDRRADKRYITERFGGRSADTNLLFLKVDITRRSSIESGLKQVYKIWGTPKALINNAALDSPPNARIGENGPFEKYSESSWDKTMDVNVKGAFLCSQVIGGSMAASGGGSIVNMSSVYGLISPDQRIYARKGHKKRFYKPAAYSVSKSALLNLTRYLATYWADKNVRVNTLTLAGVLNRQDKRFIKRYSDRVPLGRMARDDEYNGAIMFLISDASSYMTGSNLIIDGGMTAW